MSAPQLTAIVLAAGSSQRMGSQNKLLLDFRGKPLVVHIVETIVAAGVDEVVVVVGHEAERVQQLLESYPVSCVENKHHLNGMTTSINEGVRAASSTTTGFMICLADLPLIESAEFRLLNRAFEKALLADPMVIVVPVHAGQRGNPVVFSVRHKESILAQTGQTGCRAIVQGNPGHVVDVEMDTDHVLVDIDTPDAYRRIR